MKFKNLIFEGIRMRHKNYYVENLTVLQCKNKILL